MSPMEAIFCGFLIAWFAFWFGQSRGEKMRGKIIQECADKLFTERMSMSGRISQFQTAAEQWRQTAQFWEQECKRREISGSPSFNGVTPADWLILQQLVSAGRKSMARTLHPDAGGSQEQMVRVNRVADEILRRRV